MEKNTLIIGIAALVVVVIGVFFFLDGELKQGEFQTEQLDVGQTLSPIQFSQEELEALQNEGITPPSEGLDIKAEDLQTVRLSDELDAIEADIDETDVSGLDDELNIIDNDLTEF